MKWLMMRHRPLVLWPRLEPRLYGWLARIRRDLPGIGEARLQAGSGLAVHDRHGVPGAGEVIG
jgi:hypothetical protein